MQLDGIDAEILRLLQKDGRLMYKQLAARVGLAPSSCHDRVKRLRAAGVLGPVTTSVDPAKLGYILSAVVFAKISKDGQNRIDALMDRMISIPEIQRVQLVTGRYDLIVTLIARDMDHLKEIAARTFSDSDEILSYETSLAYDERRDFTVTPPGRDAPPEAAPSPEST